MLVELVASLCFKFMILIIVVLLALILWGWQRRNAHDLPPSPGVALPILGHMYLLKANPRKQFLEWGEKYGCLLSFYFGNHLAIVLYGFDTIKEAFVKNADIFSDRPKTFVMQKLGKDKGSLTYVTHRQGPPPGKLDIRPIRETDTKFLGFITSTSHWRIQRKVSIEILRELGLGTSVMEDKVQEEISRFLSNVDNQNGNGFDPKPLTMQSVSNIVCALMFGKGFKHDDPEMASCASLLGEQISLIESMMLLNFIPFLRIIPGDLFGFRKALRLADHLEQGLIKQQLQRRKLDMRENGKIGRKIEVNDFMTGYLKEIMALKNAGVHDSAVNEENLVAVVANLFAAGTETTSTTLCWAFLYLLHHPHVTERCFQEITSHVGLDRRPCYNDRQQLKYFEATVMEVQRISSMTPFAVLHTASTDIVLKNYLIPKGAIIMPSMDSVHLSTEIWGDPHVFRPERFLDASGEEIIKREEFIPFSIGRRSCLGEALARMELFLFLSTTIQRYHFRLPDGAALPPIQDIFGLSCYPLPYQICFVPR